MSIKRSLILNTGINLLGYLYLLIASFFSISILLNNLGRNVFGVYIFFVSFISLSTVFDFGISNAVIRKLSLPALSPSEKTKTWKTSFVLYIFLASVLSIVVFCLLQYLSNFMPIFSHLDRYTINLSIVFLSTIIFVNLINIHFLCLPQSQQRFDIFNSKTFLVGTANTILSAIVSYYYPNIALLFFTQLAFHLLTLVFMMVYSRRYYSGSDFLPSYDKDTGRDLFSFGIKNFIGSLAGQVENQLSNFILGAMTTASAITSFSIPQNIVIKGAGVVSQFAQVFFPLSTSLLEKDRIKKLKTLVFVVEAITLSGGLLAIVLTFLIGESFLMWWLKDAIVVESAYPVLKILSFYFALISLTPIPTALIQGLNKPQISSFFGALTVGLEIIAALLLVPLYGVVGMAYAFLVSVSITVPLFLFVSWSQLNKEINNLYTIKN